MTTTADPWADVLGQPADLDDLIVALTRTPDWNTKPVWLHNTRLALAAWLADMGWTITWSDGDRVAKATPPGYVEHVRREMVTGIARSHRLGD